jgi:serine/threonine protein kinase
MPMKHELEHHGNLVHQKPIVAKGSNGRIFNSGLFEGNPIVTKTKKKWTESTIYEVFINFVVLNSILLKGELTNNLIPSYGLFVCGSNADGTEVCIHDKKELPGQHLFLVQKYIDGETLQNRLKKPMTMYEFNAILYQLFTIMKYFESSIYQLYHMDMHCANIVLHREQVCLIDFELCSWSLFDRNGKAHRYRLNSVEHKYCGETSVLTGAYDFILFLSNVAAHDTNPEIQQFCMNKLTAIYSNFWKKKDDPIVPTYELISKNKNRWLYQVLLDVEDKSVHKRNIAILEKMTYEYIISEFF